jgi:2-amino-4-hydroxy-6-hydroxymethyldihydropteridine diphosphokinase
VTRAYVALGSNLGDSPQQVRAAMDALDALPGTRVSHRSPLYLTPPWGLLEQPPFINAVVALDTDLPPDVLLDALLQIEAAAGRVRVERNGPRILDLDLLHMDGVTRDDERLTLPHPRLRERAFVLLPLCTIAPGLDIPDVGIVSALLKNLDVSGCERLS